MGVTMSDQEIAGFISDHGDAVLTTLRADGRPVPLPVWYVAFDGVLYFQTPPRSKKVANIERDPRVAVLLDDGERWEHLRGVLIQGTAERVTDEALHGQVLTAFNELFADRRMSNERLPSSAATRYSAMAVYRVKVPEGPVSWDNSKLRLRAEPAKA